MILLIREKVLRVLRYLAGTTAVVAELSAGRFLTKASLKLEEIVNSKLDETQIRSLTTEHIRQPYSTEYLLIQICSLRA